MSSSLNESWQHYIEAEERGYRPAILASLGEVISALELLPADERIAWVRNFCITKLEGEVIPQVRQPLFDTIFLPVLTDLYNKHEAGAARWLAALSQNLYRCRQSWLNLENGNATELSLLRRAIEDDPSDQRARRSLVKELARVFEHAIHEVPLGVIYGMNGASIEQCDELLLGLNFFDEQVELEGTTEEWCNRRCKWELHFRGYRDYL